MKDFRYNQKSLYAFALALPLVLVITMSFGAGFSMSMDKNGVMSNCPFMNSSASICPMSIMEHLVRWQQLFAFIIPASNALILLFLLVIVVYGIFSKELLNKITQKFPYFRLYQEQNIFPKIFNPIFLLLSSGILNPKIYFFSR